MSEHTQKLVEYFNGLAELRDYFDHRFKQLLRSKGVRGWNDDDYELSHASENGIELKTFDRDRDAEYHFFPLADLDVDVDELNRREVARLAKERADSDARVAALTLRQAADAEQRDQTEYKRLKAKYESA